MKTISIAAEELPLRTSIRIAGAPGTVATNSQAVIDSLCDLGCDNSTATGVFSFKVSVGNSAAPRLQEPYFRGMNHFVLAEFSYADIFLFDLMRRTVTATVSPEIAAQHSFWTKILIPIAAGVMGPTLGVIPVHAACLIMDGKGFLLAGQSGSGKSTLAVALAQIGFGYVADDWTYVTHESKQLKAHGLQPCIKLLPDAVRFFPQLETHRLQRSMNGELAYEVDASDLGFQHSESCRPGAVVFVERVQSGSELVPLDPQAALDYFLSSAERLPEELTMAIHNRAKVLRHIALLPGYLFRYSGAPREGAMQLRRLLERTPVNGR